MKPIYNFLQSYAVTLIFLVLLSLVIWLRGPEVSWHTITPLQNTEERLCAIIFVWLAWLLKFIFIDTNTRTSINVSASLSPEIKKKLIRLQGRFEGAIEFLTKTVINKHGKNVNLLRLPWYLVIGPKSSGKSTLLANANINFILSKNFKAGNPKTITQSDMCDWWVTRDLVLVDIPGTYLSSKSRHAPSISSMYSILWEHLLKLIQPFHKKNPIQGIIIALNLPEILKFQRQEKTQIVHDLKKRINELLDYFGHQLPIQLIITKCDLLPGFSEFFSEYSIDEIAQPWGITLPPRTNESLLDLFTHRFNALIKRLNKQIISKLHQERNAAARPYIKDFPLHMERLKEGITQLLKALSLPQLPLQGIYLTSGTQEIEKEQNTFTPVNHEPHTGFDNQNLQIMSLPPLPTRTYFVRQLILNQLLMTPAAETKKSSSIHWQKRCVYLSSIGIICIAATLLGRDFYTGLQKTYAIQNHLNEYQDRIKFSNQKGQHLIQSLPLLNALQDATEDQTHTLSFYSKKSRQTAEVVYQQALQTIVIPEIQKYFESYLRTANNDAPENNYLILKAYLMLGDKEHYQADFVTQTLLRLMPNSTDKTAIAALSEHIHNALKSIPLSVKLDTVLVNNLRKSLLSLPITTLGFVILKNNELYTQTAIDLQNNFNASVFTNPLVTTHIPLMYTAKGFQQITEIEIPRIATEVLRGNWVLGATTADATPLASEELASQLQLQYVTNYIDTWERLLANTQLKHPQNLAQASDMVALLVSSNSPLLLLLDIFKQHTSFAPILTGSPKLQNLNVLLTDANANQPGGLYGVFVGLKQLQAYLDPLIKSGNPNKAIFEATATRMQDPTKDPLTQLQVIAETAPEPMKTWVTHIATQTWHLMVKETHEYIEQAWQQTIMAPYHTSIENRYPFNQHAAAEVDLQQFTHFLGQPGQLSTFYQVYLKPFILETGKKREWRIVNNEKIGFSDSIFEKYQHISAIQRAFFPNGDNKLYVPFTLQPVELDKSVKSFAININGQEIKYQKNMPRVISWPGNNNSPQSTIDFVTPNNQLISNTASGNWGWFKLVTQATQTIRSRKELMLNFAANGYHANYVLFTQGPLNPFLPMNLARFQLPEKLGNLT